MSDIEITIKVPEQLVERARAVRMSVEEEAAKALIKALEQDIQAREAAQKLLDIAEQIDTLPDDIKPTPDEITAYVRQARAEIVAKNSQDK